MLQKQELIATVKNRFIVALACQEEIALADSLVILSNKVHTASVSQAIAGKVSFSDTLKSSAEFELARIQRDRIEQSRINAFQELASLWGSAQIDFKCEKDENNSRYVLPDSSALFAVLAESPQMKIAGSELNKKSAELKSEKAGRIPTVRAGGGIGVNYGTNEISPRVSLSFSIPLINWNQGAVNAAYHGVSQAEARCDAMRIETYNNVLSAYRNAARLQKEIHVFENVILPQSKEYLEAYFAAYVSGKMGILSLIEAQHSFFEVSRELAEINREYRLSIIDLGRYTVTRVPVTKPSMKD
jgi:outer membrane protein TolC